MEWTPQLVLIIFTVHSGEITLIPMSRRKGWVRSIAMIVICFEMYRTTIYLTYLDKAPGGDTNNLS